MPFAQEPSPRVGQAARRLSELGVGLNAWQIETAPRRLVPASVPSSAFAFPISVAERGMVFRKLDEVDRHVLKWVRNPDVGSSFEKVARKLSWLPDRAVLGLLRAFRYGGLIFQDSWFIFAHVFFQRHGDALHMFSVAVHDTYARKGCGEKALVKFIEHAKATPGIKRVRLGAGGHPGTARICEKIEARASELGLEPEGSGWLSFVNPREKR